MLASMSWTVRMSGIISPALCRTAANFLSRSHSMVNKPRWYMTKMSRPLKSSSAVSKSLEAIIDTLKDRTQASKSIERAMLSLIDLNKKSSRVHSHYLYPEVKHLFLSTITADQAGHMLWLCKQNHYKDLRLIVELLSLIQKEEVKKLTEEHLMSVCWSLAHYKLQKDYQVLLGNVSAEVTSRLVSKPQLMISHIAFICWSYVIMDYWPEQLTGPLIRLVESDLNQIPMWDLSIIVWSMVKMGVASEGFLSKVGQVTADKIGSSKEQSLCMLLWSFGHLNYYEDQLFNRLSEEVVSGGLLSKCSPRTLSTFMWACSKVSYYNHELMESFAERSFEILNKLNPQDISLIVYGFGCLNHINVELIRAMADQLVAIPYRRTTTAVLNTLWGCLVSDIYPHNLIQIAVSEVSRLLLSNTGQKQYNYTQMLQLNLASEVEHPQLNLPSLPSKLHGQVLLQTIDQTLHTRKSIYDANVHYALYHLFQSGEYFRRGVQSFSGYELDAEILLDENNEVVAIPENCYRLRASKVTEMLADKFQLNCKSTLSSNDWLTLASDWGVEDDEVMKRVKRKIAIEADGIYHYAVNCRHKMGRTVLKHRQLMALGWEVLSLPYYEWDPLRSNEDQDKFLQKSLEQLGCNL